ncbi:ribonuclease III [Arenimonas oryziterrae]|uniref:ribonuclease III n=1 Tax=Arenimonas oryziterrae TaxID=498055 RepID=UPI0003B434BE|nr:ribonuclease III [Arenimonas oryziterrae]
MPAEFGHQFLKPELLRQALRHRSAGVPNNERLEFLGDALVNLIVAEALHARWPKADEGALTRARASLVRESALASIARAHGLGEQIELGMGEMKTGGHRRDSILADALEALVGAIHLDAGFETCRKVVLPWFDAMLAELPAGKVDKDPKTRLQEWLQARQRERPNYSLIETLGQEHERVFRVRCTVAEPALSAEAEGSSLRAAEQAAAELVLGQLETNK